MEEKRKIDIDLKPEIARGVYSTFTVITHSSSEFICDFIQALPGSPKPEVVSRIIMSPDHAKRFLKALQDNIEKYESKEGPIVLKSVNSPILPPTGEA